MNNPILTISLIAAISAASLLANAQGNVAFANQTTTAISNLYTGQKLTGAAGTYMFGLYVGPAGSTASQLTLVGTGVNANWPANSPVDGFFSIGNPFMLPNGYPAGTQIAFQVRGWPAGAGNSFEAAIVNFGYFGPGWGMFGESALGFVTPTAPPNFTATLFGSGPGQIWGFYLGVPEPSTFALGTLGAFMIWRLRRRGKFRKSPNEQSQGVMKKAVLLSMLLAFTSIGIPPVRAQGNVAFANQTTTAVTDAFGAKLTAAAGTYMFGLYVGPVGTMAWNLTLVGTGVNANWPANSPVDGFFSIGNPFTLPNGYPAGTPIAFQVRMWFADAGNTFEATLANASSPHGGYGWITALGSVTPTAPPSGAAPLFGPPGNGLVNSFTLYPSPEPSGLTIGLLGAALFALPMARRHCGRKG